MAGGEASRSVSCTSASLICIIQHLFVSMPRQQGACQGKGGASTAVPQGNK